VSCVVFNVYRNPLLTPLHRIIDPKWPQWEDEYDMSEGPRGDVITSIPRDAAVVSEN